MKSWQITAKEKLELVQATELLPEGHARVRIIKAGICGTDKMLYCGKFYGNPIIPCRHAVGKISEIGENEFGLKKGDNVVLDPYVPCMECYFCKTEDYCNCQNMGIYGLNRSGFLRDFAVMPQKNLRTLPENVNIEDAIYVEYIATAIRLLDELDIQKGEHVTIMGAGILGNIIAQLVIYYQAIYPHRRQRNLEIAKQATSSITPYPTSEHAGKSIHDNGGRLARYVIYVSGSKIHKEHAVLRLKRRHNRNCWDNWSSMMADLNIALKKQLVIKSVKNGCGNFDSAINLLATKTVDLSAMSCKLFSFGEADKAFEQHKDEDLSNIFQLVVDCLAE